VLNELFRRNQENFIAGSAGDVIPIIAVMEEAQSVLPRGVSDSSPFVAWVKEGRKYQLGAILVTQQPGSIAPELLSQGDNFFAFHLLSVGDLKGLQGHNAHYSDDVLASILNEPIKGNAYLWSAPDQPFVLPCRIHNFEAWADELANAQKPGKSLSETPAEIQRREEPRRRDKLDKIVREQLANDTSIALHTVAELDGTAQQNTVAVNQWNLLFSIGEKIAIHSELFEEFGSLFPDGKKIFKEEACIDSLSRLGLLLGKGSGDDGKTYFLINNTSIQRTSKPSALKLRK
jgi:hypothetical protein